MDVHSDARPHPIPLPQERVIRSPPAWKSCVRIEPVIDRKLGNRRMLSLLPGGEGQDEGELILCASGA